MILFVVASRSPQQSSRLTANKRGVRQGTPGNQAVGGLIGRQDERTVVVADGLEAGGLDRGCDVKDLIGGAPVDTA